MVGVIQKNDGSTGTLVLRSKEHCCDRLVVCYIICIQLVALWDVEQREVPSVIK